LARQDREGVNVYALLAFPAAGIVGYTGSAMVTSVRSESAPITSPAPNPVNDNKPSSSDQDDDQNPPREDRHVMRNV
jgi:hypothetical protein